MSHPIPPSVPGGHPQPVQPADAKKQTTPATTKPQLLVQSDKLPDTPDKNLQQRSVTSTNPESTASILSQGKGKAEAGTNNETALQNAMESYSQKMDEYRSCQGERWLKDHHGAMMDLLAKPGKKKNQSFCKMYVMLDGQKHQVIPDGKTLSKKERSQAIEYLKNQITKTVDQLPDVETQTTKIEQFEKEIATSYKTLVDLGKPPKLKPEEDILSMGLRIDFLPGQSPKVSGYHPEAEELASPAKKDSQLSFQGFGILTDPPEIETDALNS